MQELRRILHGGADPLDLGQVDTLDLLVDRGAVRMRDLAGALRIDASSATRAVSRLVEAGLAARRAEPGDARVVVVEVTPAGHRRHADLVRRRRDMLAEVLRDFSEAERAALAGGLERLVAGVDRYVRAHGDPPAGR